MAAVLQPLQGLSLDGGIMDPSPISPGASRHGRSKHGGSVAKSNKRGRGYSVVDDREALIAKALAFVLKRTVDEDAEQEEGEEKLVADSDGWADCEDVLARPNLTALEVTLDELKALVSVPKSRFAIKPISSKIDESDPSDYLIRLLPSVPQTPTSASAVATLTPLSITTEDLPDLIVYECSYASYPLILASGGIKRAGGQAQLTFQSITVEEDGTETRPASTADVSIFLNLRAVLEAEPKISWARTEAGAVVTAGDKDGVVSKTYWGKVVARRADIGVLYENGEVRKEIPVGLRGKGVKAKKGKSKGAGVVVKEMKASSSGGESGSE